MSLLKVSSEADGTVTTVTTESVRYNRTLGERVAIQMMSMPAVIDLNEETIYYGGAAIQRVPTPLPAWCCLSQV